MSYMPPLNIDRLIQISTVIETGRDLAVTSVRVAQDPPVRKAADQFRVDAIETVKSGKVLATEVHASWQRHRSA